MSRRDSYELIYNFITILKYIHTYFSKLLGKIIDINSIGAAQVFSQKYRHFKAKYLKQHNNVVISRQWKISRSKIIILSEFKKY